MTVKLLFFRNGFAKPSRQTALASISCSMYVPWEKGIDSRQTPFHNFRIDPRGLFSGDNLGKKAIKENIALALKEVAKKHLNTKCFWKEPPLRGISSTLICFQYWRKLYAQNTPKQRRSCGSKSSTSAEPQVQRNVKFENRLKTHDKLLGQLKRELEHASLISFKARHKNLHTQFQRVPSSTLMNAVPLGRSSPNASLTHCTGFQRQAFR